MATWLSACVSIAIVVLGVGPTQADSASEAADSAAAAFRCSEYARLGPGVGGIQMTMERVRLLAYGIKKAREAGADAMSFATVPPDWVKPVTDDFWIGFALARAIDDVDFDLANEAQSDSPAKSMEMTGILAARAFSQGNCTIIGK